MLFLVMIEITFIVKILFTLTALNSCGCLICQWLSKEMCLWKFMPFMFLFQMPLEMAVTIYNIYTTIITLQAIMLMVNVIIRILECLECCLALNTGIRTLCIIWFFVLFQWFLLSTFVIAYITYDMIFLTYNAFTCFHMCFEMRLPFKTFCTFSTTKWPVNVLLGVKIVYNGQWDGQGSHHKLRSNKYSSNSSANQWLRNTHWWKVQQQTTRARRPVLVSV